MDREQEEMQFLGLFGICKESSKVILSRRKIFSQITLALILPPAFVFLLHIQVSNVLSLKVAPNEIKLHRTGPENTHYDTISDVLSLLSTSAVGYTIACMHNGRDVAFGKVMSVVPRVWRRLMVTFLCIFVTKFAYQQVAGLILFACGKFISKTSFGVVIVILLGITFVVGYVYMTIVWQLASVVSVWEEDYGVKAMIKSKDLIKGKMGVSIVIFFTLNTSLYLLQFAFEGLVVHGRSADTLGRFGYGALSFLLLSMLMLFGLVVQTMLYFVCKSYHRENIDKSALSDHLKVYLGQHIPLKIRGRSA